MSVTKRNSILLNAKSSAPTGTTGLIYIDDGTNSNNILRFYDGSSYRTSQRLPDTITISDQKSSGTNGGSITGGTATTRVLNTVSASKSWLSLSSNVFTIDGANYPGNYYIEWQTPVYNVDTFTSWLENDNTSAVVRMGSSSGAWDTNASIFSYGFYYANITSSLALKIVTQCLTTQTTNGLGISNSLNTVEFYTQVHITKF